MPGDTKYKLELRMTGSVEIETDTPEELPLPHATSWTFTLGTMFSGELSAEDIRTDGGGFEVPTVETINKMFEDGANSVIAMAYELEAGVYSMDTISSFVKRAGIDCGLHLHGEAPPEAIAALAESGLKVTGQLLPSSAVN